MPVQINRRYRKERLSKGKRNELSNFYSEIFSRRDDLDMATKSKGIEAKEVPAQVVAEFSYVDSNGVPQTLDLGKVKNLGETEWAENQKLFPDATQAFVSFKDGAFDEDGRPNLLNENLVIVEAVRYLKGEFGPQFILRGAHPVHGEVSIFCPGKVGNEAMEQIAGISLKDGSKPGPGQLPVWIRFIHVKEGGATGNGYYLPVPAVQELPESESDE